MRALNSEAENFDILNARFTMHSPRIERATEDKVRQTPIEQIAVNGRCTSLTPFRKLRQWWKDLDFEHENVYIRLKRNQKQNQKQATLNQRVPTRSIQNYRD